MNYNSLVVCVDDNAKKVYSNKKYINEDNYYEVNPFECLENDIILHSVNLNYFQDKEYLENINIVIYSTDFIKKLREFDKNCGTPLRYVTINFKKLFKDKKYTENNFTYTLNNSFIDILYNDKKYLQLHINIDCSRVNPSRKWISTFIINSLDNNLQFSLHSNLH